MADKKRNLGNTMDISGFMEQLELAETESSPEEEKSEQHLNMGGFMDEIETVPEEMKMSPEDTGDYQEAAYTDYVDYEEDSAEDFEEAEDTAVSNESDSVNGESSQRPGDTTNSYSFEYFQDDDFADGDDSDLYDEDDYDSYDEDGLDDVDELFEEDGNRKKRTGGKSIQFNGKAKIAVVVLAVVVILGCGIGLAMWSDSNSLKDISLKQASVTVELGEKMDDKVSAYAQGDDVKRAKLDASGVKVDKVGTYKAYITCGRTKLEMEVKVQDTVAPVVTLIPDIRVTAGVELSSDWIIASMDDKAEIASVAFKENAIQDGTLDSKGKLSAATCRYDAIGDVTNILIVTDENGNASETPVAIYVTDNYPLHVAGINDKTIAKGATDTDYMEGITWDELVTSVTCDSSKVDAGAEGQYEIIYTITGNDADEGIGRTATVVQVAKTVTVGPEDTAEKSEDSEQNNESQSDAAASTSNRAVENTSSNSSSSSTSEDTAPAEDTSAVEEPAPTTPEDPATPEEPSNGNGNDVGTDSGAGGDSGSTDTGSGADAGTDTGVTE